MKNALCDGAACEHVELNQKKKHALRIYMNKLIFQQMQLFNYLIQFKMDKTSLIIGMLLFLAFMSPIAYVLLKQKSQEAGNRKNLNKIALANNLSLDKMETIGHLSLGLDSNLKKLIVLEYSSLETAKVVDLKKVDQVRIAKRLETDHSGKIKKEKIIHLALELAGKKQSNLAEITFYDEDDIMPTPKQSQKQSCCFSQTNKSTSL